MAGAPGASRARAASRCRTAHASCRPRSPICFRLPLNLRRTRAQRKANQAGTIITITITIVITIDAPG